MSVQFQYDHNGLRTRKTVTENGVTTATDYALHGKLITHLTQGTNNLHFFYDAQSRPVKVEFNGTMYTYLHNLQGDVVGIVDNEGALVVEYKYDAWGKPISTWTLTAEYQSLATLNPFRYRGYVYDGETGLYYLRSRYYNPARARFLNIDATLSKLGKLFAHNLYAYCVGNPISYLDFAGTDEVYFNVYLKPANPFDIGHTDISINGTTYTYGRYDPSETWGIMGMMGAGVLEVGPRQLFIDDQLDKGRAVSSFQLDLTSDEVAELQGYFDNMVAMGTAWNPKDANRSQEIQRYKFPSGAFKEYNLFTNNCTTVALDALRRSIAKFPASIYSFIPSHTKQLFAENFFLKSMFNKIVKSIVEYGY